MKLKIWFNIVLSVSEPKHHHPQLCCIRGSGLQARLHVDFAGPMDGRMYLIVVDAHSKWLEALPMATATSLTMTQHLRTLVWGSWVLSMRQCMAPNLQWQSFNCFVNRMENVTFRWHCTIPPPMGWLKEQCKQLKGNPEI